MTSESLAALDDAAEMQEANAELEQHGIVADDGQRFHDMPEYVELVANHDQSERWMMDSLAAMELERQQLSAKSKELRKEMREVGDRLRGERAMYLSKVEELRRKFEHRDDLPASDAASTSNEGEAPLPASTEWQATPTAELHLSSIKGMSEKKAAEIAEAYPTVGALESLRAQGSGKGIGLQSISRVGPELAGKIEDRLIEWIGKYAAGTVNQLPPEQPSEAAATPTVEAAVDPAEPFEWSNDWPRMTPGKRADYIIARGDLLNNGEQDSLNCKHDEAAYEAGCNAFKLPAGQLTDCPLPPGPAQDDWIRGFVSEQVLASYGDGEDGDLEEEPGPSGDPQPIEPEAEPQPAATATTSTVYGDDLDFLN